MKEIYCNIHGNQMKYAIVCQHLFECLRSQKKVGFCVPWEEIKEGEPKEAWCDNCHKILDQERGWNDTSEAAADFKLICSDCYADIRDLNE